MAAGLIGEVIRIDGWRLLGIVSLALLLAGCAAPPSGPQTVKVTIGSELFNLEVAADVATITTGLMHRTSIAPDGGMIFIFPRPQIQGFWMGHCLVDMDIAYLDARGRVTAVHTMKVEPPQRAGESNIDYDRRMPKYSSGLPAQFAIELRAGTLQRLGVKPDDKIDLDLNSLKAMAR